MSAPEASTAIGFGRYEPEGIYLAPPLQYRAPIVQQWGDNGTFYKNFTYNGVPLRGYMGLGFDARIGSAVHTVEPGRVTEVSIERGGLGRYIKLEHRWGESLYGCLRRVDVESGQTVRQGERLGQTGTIDGTTHRRLHIGLRIAPYNRFDGWGGFTNPLPFFDPQAIYFSQESEELVNEELINEELKVVEDKSFPPLPMPVEHSTMRRP